MSGQLIKRKNHIWVRFQVEGTHCYPAALTDPALKEVKFLGHPHRHIFHFKVGLEVTHEDRDVEFILFKRELQDLFKEKVINIDYKSCEMLSDDLAYKISELYPKRNVTISVSEDNENGSYAEYKYEEF